VASKPRWPNWVVEYSTVNIFGQGLEEIGDGMFGHVLLTTRKVMTIVQCKASGCSLTFPASIGNTEHKTGVLEGIVAKGF
jgi:hypothetical protein